MPMILDVESGMNIRRFRALRAAGATYAEIAAYLRPAVLVLDEVGSLPLGRRRNPEPCERRPRWELRATGRRVHRSSLRPPCQPPTQRPAIRIAWRFGTAL
jgi:hypothetical protein